jgi:hypothetical protein
MKYKKGDEVSYNVVDESGAYNVTGEIVRVHKDGTFDVDTGFKVDKRVDVRTVDFGTKHPIGVIKIEKR